ncbi:prolyl aminopeptidase [Solimonas marina]|uniref:Proline iminopeptidase n=1 Tax=Solimonas marina TaxID=2714601 RepID=A0A969W8L0_9GAMM|nr:prolyl aminopeptidase [Solimonas marina]NKF21899.1 prolyl aminopeptidase [Solimonas marina]
MSEPDRPLYPPIEPHAHGWLAVGDGHEVYWESCGAAHGQPVVFVHGGPGSGCVAEHRRFFDPQHYRIVLFDQRGCGRSRPAARLDANTTADLSADLERLRAHLGIARWIVFGGSWGSTVALDYARRHPTPVRALVLRGVFLARRSEVDAFACGLRAFVPQAWQGLAQALGFADETSARGGALAQRCAQTVLHGEPADARAAASAWLTMEAEAMALTQGKPPTPIGDPLAARTRVYMHYMAHDFFLQDGELLDAADALPDVPIDIVQGTLDVVCPPVSAWELAQRLPHARLQWVCAGHSAFEPALRSALVGVMDRLREARP